MKINPDTRRLIIADLWRRKLRLKFKEQLSTGPNILLLLTCGCLRSVSARRDIAAGVWSQMQRKRTSDRTQPRPSVTHAGRGYNFEPERAVSSEVLFSSPSLS